MEKEIITIYTDGSCLENPGYGGWAALLLFKTHRKEITGAEIYTTNNRMELTAAIQALSAIKQNFPIMLYSDSRYVIDGIEKYCPKWKLNGWKTSQKKPVENRDLWEKLDILNESHQIKWCWVKAHANHPKNNLVDELARQSALKIQQEAKNKPARGNK